MCGIAGIANIGPSGFSVGIFTGPDEGRAQKEASKGHINATVCLCRATCGPSQRRGGPSSIRSLFLSVFGIRPRVIS